MVLCCRSPRKLMKAHYTLYFSPLLSSSWVFVLFLNRGQGGRYLIHLNLNPDPIIYLLSSINSLNFSKFQVTHMASEKTPP